MFPGVKEARLLGEAGGSGEESEDSDLDVDKALIVPTKTLFVSF